MKSIPGASASPWLKPIAVAAIALILIGGGAACDDEVICGAGTIERGGACVPTQTTEYPDWYQEEPAIVAEPTGGRDQACNPDGGCDGVLVCLDGRCDEPPCVPECGTRECGSDGCGGDCGECDSWASCEDGACADLKCISLGRPCEDGSPPCCTGEGSYQAACNETESSYEGRCCVGYGRDCRTSSDCCGALVCKFYILFGNEAQTCQPQ